MGVVQEPFWSCNAVLSVNVGDNALNERLEVNRRLGNLAFEEA